LAESRGGAENGDPPPSPSPPGVSLTGPERELLLKACQRYRATIPAYLKSGEAERQLLDAVMAKLSRS